MLVAVAFREKCQEELVKCGGKKRTDTTQELLVKLLEKLRRRMERGSGPQPTVTWASHVNTNFL